MIVAKNSPSFEGFLLLYLSLAAAAAGIFFSLGTC
jgi:hypothetical protein